MLLFLVLFSQSNVYIFVDYCNYRGVVRHNTEKHRYKTLLSDIARMAKKATSKANAELEATRNALAEKEQLLQQQ